MVDNVFATPVLSRPLEHGADVVVYSATKHIDGQGRVLGGAILGSREYIRGPVQKLVRATGPSLSPFNAWVLLKGLETLSLRVRHQAAPALHLAQWLERHPAVASVRYPYLRSASSTSPTTSVTRSPSSRTRPPRPTRRSASRPARRSA